MEGTGFLFWIVAVALAAIVTGAIALPLLRRPTAMPSRAEHDAEVYGSQLAELKADVERGTMPAAEAETARAEIGRRLLKATAEAEVARSGGRGAGRTAAVAGIVFVALAVPLASVAAYLGYGSPDMPDLPLEARLSVDPAAADLPTLVAQAEARLRTHPEDGAGWDMLGPVYLRSGRPNDAVEAFANASRLLGPTPERETGLGEALTQAAAGEVTDEAKARFEWALQLNADYLPARFFLALDLSQENRFAEAGPAWTALIAASPEGAPWLQLAQLALDDANAKIAAAANPQAPAAGTQTAPAQPGPSGDEMAAAAEMSGADRQAMIEGMVSQLAERLKSAPNDVEGWKRLMQSYSVLGDADRARGALTEATGVFAAGTPERADIERFASGLGLEAPVDGAAQPAPGASTAQ